MARLALTPARRRGIEWLDGDTVPIEARTRAYADLAVSNRWLGGLRAVRLELLRLLPELPRAATLLDVGAGDADIAPFLRAQALRAGVRLDVVAVDFAPAMLERARARDRAEHVVCANALALPLASRSVDVVICSQVLHHFVYDDALAVLRELHRVARRRVIVADLRRSWIAAGGFWLASFPLNFHPVVRHDGVVSVLRGFTADELRAMVVSAVGVRPEVERRLGYRLTASWTP